MGTRIVAIWGSESDTAKNGIKALVKKWDAEKGAKFTVDVMSGDEAAKGGIATLKDRYDVILISTSSYGMGEAPGHYQDFLGALIRAGQAGETPFEGKQHAVLGYGDTIYADTFQNCPRLSDKFMGELGSRRFVQRAEIDASGDDADQKTPAEYERWGSEVFSALQKGLPAADSKPVCEWTVPAGDIVTDGITDKSFPVVNLVVGIAVVALGVGGYFAKQHFFDAESVAF